MHLILDLGTDAVRGGEILILVIPKLLASKLFISFSNIVAVASIGTRDL